MYLVHLEGEISDFSQKLFPRLASREPPYKDALDWIYFFYMGDTKGVYMVPENMAFYFDTPVEGEALFLTILKHLWTIYLGAYTQCAMFKIPMGPEGGDLELGKSTHKKAYGFELFLGGSNPSPTRFIGQLSLVGAYYDLLPITVGCWTAAGVWYM